MRTQFLTLTSILMCSLAAQAATDVHIVDDDGPADFTSIAVAVAAASAGDTVLVRSGTYAGFTVVAKPLVVIADTDALVTISSEVSVEAIPFGEHFALAGMRLQPTTAPAHALRLTDNAGAIWIERNLLRGTSDPLGSNLARAAVRVQNCGEVAFMVNTIQGGHGFTQDDEDVGIRPTSGAPGVDAFAVNLTFYDCFVNGGHGGSELDTTDDDGGNGGSAVALEQGSIFASGCILAGGNGGHADSDLFACGDGGDGGQGLDAADNGVTGHHLATIFQGGAAGSAFGFGTGCDDGNSGSPINGTGLEELDGSARSLSLSSPNVELGTLQITVTGVPGEAAFLLLNGVLDPHYQAGMNGQLMLPPPYRGLPIGIIPAEGVLTTTLPLPSLAPGIESRTQFVQSIFINASAQRVLGGGAVLVTLSQSL